MKYKFFIIPFFICFQLYSQNDLTTNFINQKGQKTTIFSEAKLFENISRVNDSLWLIKRFRKNGKLHSYWHSKTRDSKNKIGQSVLFDNKDSISAISFYNTKGLKHGKSTSWFFNRNKNSEGRYVNGEREGIWNHYHYNGKLAARQYFKNDSLLKIVFFDDLGKKKEGIYSYTDKKAVFKGGINKFHQQLSKLSKRIKTNIKGEITVDFMVDVHGNIEVIEIYETIPISAALKKEITLFFESIKGWKPAENMGRKTAKYISIPLIFK